MNTYVKYCPNVFVAKCTEKQEKNSIIELTTKYGKINKCEVHSFLGAKDGYFLYSITSADGFNSQQHAENKANKLQGYAENAEQKSTQYYEASKEGKDFLVLGEPIKIGHHSERRHRKLIERNWERMGKSITESEKAKEYKRRAEYWKEKSTKIDLSNPDSLEYFEEELRKAKEYHQLLKDLPEKRSHSMSLQYASKAVKDLQDKVNTAIKLWGTEEENDLINKEKKKEAERKANKNTAKWEFIKSLGGFFSFNTEQFNAGINNAKEIGILEEGEKVTYFGMGLYIPSKNKDQFIQKYK